jgi:hypothetical protein
MPFPWHFGPGARFPGLPEAEEVEEFLELDNLPYERIASHGDEAVSWLLEQFKGKPKIEALVRALVAPVQRLEDVMWQVLTRVVDMEHAEGVHLDLFGRILQLPRAGLADDEYRSRLRVWQLVLRSNGRAEELIHIADRFDDVSAVAGDKVIFDEGSLWVGDAMVITMDHLMTYSPTTLLLFLRKAKAAGKGLQLIWEPDGPGATFAVADGYDAEEEDEAEGFAYDDETNDDGGTLADVRN